MALWTSYLAFLKKGVAWKDGKPWAIVLNNGTVKKAKFVYVMRNRGNNEVAPYEDILRAAKKGEIGWKEYADNYVNVRLYTRNAVLWMKKIGELAKKQEVVLICLEKDAEHCHRTLLAQNVVKWSRVEYKGELPLVREATFSRTK